MRKTLTKNFFNRPTLVVTEKLLGKFLVRRKGKKEESYMITEVEAYDGFKDRASHGSRGRNKRSEMMFGPPGYWFVYLTYGMYWMMNVVTGAKGYPAAVLIRGVSEISGPGKLTRNLKIDKKLNNKLISKKNGLWIEDRGVRNIKFKRTPRIGIDFAGPYWAKRKYRFLLVEVD